MRLKSRSAVDQRLAVVIGGGVAVVVESQCACPNRRHFVLLVVRAVDGAAAVGGGAGKVADRVERPGDGVRRAGDGVVARVERAAGDTISSHWCIFSSPCVSICLISRIISSSASGVPAPSS